MAGLPQIRLICSDVLAGLKTLPDNSIQCCITSPPYWGLRDYGIPDQLGLEKTPEEYIAKMVEIFQEVRRVLRKDGTLWLNLGDSFSSGGRTSYDSDAKLPNRCHSFRPGSGRADGIVDQRGQRNRNGTPPCGLKSKDLVGIPWRVALALQTDGWWLRSDIIWSKPNPMPESVTDRPTRAHEYIFLLTKSAKYYYDQEAVRKKHSREWWKETVNITGGECPDRNDGGNRQGNGSPAGRNLRSVWEIATKAFPEAHFATFPPAIPERCIKAGSKEGDLILDPFSGAGTTAMVAAKLGRNAIGIELNPDYVEMSIKRLKKELGMLMEIVQ